MAIKIRNCHLLSSIFIALLITATTSFSLTLINTILCFVYIFVELFYLAHKLVDTYPQSVVSLLVYAAQVIVILCKIFLMLLAFARCMYVCAQLGIYSIVACEWNIHEVLLCHAISFSRLWLKSLFDILFVVILHYIMSFAMLNTENCIMFILCRSCLLHIMVRVFYFTLG